MREIQTRKILIEAEVFVLSGSGDRSTVNKKQFMNTISHGTHHPVVVCDIFYCTGHMEVASTNNCKFIRYCMKGMMYELDPRKELLEMINFDGTKVVQVEGKLLG